MRHTFFILAGFLLATNVQAQNASDFKWDAEIRARYSNYQNKAFLKGESGANTADWAQRMKLGLSLSKGENLSGRFSVVHNNTWGDRTNQSSVKSPGTYDGSVTDAAGNKGVTKGNSLTVYEAWGLWKSGDAGSLKFGRAAFVFGDQTIFGANDWGPVPASFEGVWADWKLEAINLTAFGLKTRESTAAISGNDDPEQNHYGLVGNFKTVPESIKYGGFHVIQTNDDDASVLGLSTNSGAAVASGSASILRYGLTVKGASSGVDYRATVDMVSGKVKSASEVTLSGSMYDLEGGYSLPEFMNGRVSLAYHRDSGPSDNTTADKIDVYMPLKPNMHPFAGVMDFISWGNMTYIDVGLSLKPADDVTTGLNYIMFNRTTDKGNVTVNGTSYGTGSDKTAIGNEVDLWVEKKYEGSFSIYALYGMFMPGDLIKKSTPERPDTASLLQLQGKMTF